MSSLWHPKKIYQPALLQNGQNLDEVAPEMDEQHQKLRKQISAAQAWPVCGAWHIKGMTKFKEFPFEIRAKIFGLAAAESPARVLNIYLKDGRLGCHVANPQILYACSESRKEALSLYKPLEFDGQSTGTYVNFEIDTILFDTMFPLLKVFGPSPEYPDFQNLCRKLAFHKILLDRPYGVKILQRFVKLEEVAIVMYGCYDHPDDLGGLEIVSCLERVSYETRNPDDTHDIPKTEIMIQKAGSAIQLLPHGSSAHLSPHSMDHLTQHLATNLPQAQGSSMYAYPIPPISMTVRISQLVSELPTVKFTLVTAERVSSPRIMSEPEKNSARLQRYCERLTIEPVRKDEIVAYKLQLAIDRRQAGPEETAAEEAAALVADESGSDGEVFDQDEFELASNACSDIDSDEWFMAG